MTRAARSACGPSRARGSPPPSHRLRSGIPVASMPLSAPAPFPRAQPNRRLGPLPDLRGCDVLPLMCRRTAASTGPRASRSAAAGPTRAPPAPAPLFGAVRHQPPPPRPALRAVAFDAGLLRRRRDYRLLVAGQFVSLAGSELTFVAVPVQTFQLTGSPPRARGAGAP